MEINKLKRLAKEPRIVLGGSLQLPSPHLIEIIGHAGFDFVNLDTEHGPYEMEAELTNLIRACEVSGLTSLVRLTENEPTRILKALDAGAGGIIVPRVRSVYDVERAIAAAKYPPLGDRGSCGNTRAAKFSAQDGSEYYPMANRETMVALVIEETEAVDQIDDILSVDGIDMIWLGPGDLSTAMGYAGQLNHPEVIAALEKVTAAANVRDIPVTALATLDNPDQMQFWVDRGVHIFLLSITKTVFLTLNDLANRAATLSPNPGVGVSG